MQLVPMYQHTGSCFPSMATRLWHSKECILFFPFLSVSFNIVVFFFFSKGKFALSSAGKLMVRVTISLKVSLKLPPGPSEEVISCLFLHGTPEIFATEGNFIYCWLLLFGHTFHTVVWEGLFITWLSVHN